jgi:ATP-binding cassette subfamily B (MDR/TAP) protein 1
VSRFGILIRLNEADIRVFRRGSIGSQALYAASQGISFCIIALVFYVGSLWLISGRYQTSEFFTVLTSVVSGLVRV